MRSATNKNKVAKVNEKRRNCLAQGLFSRKWISKFRKHLGKLSLRNDFHFHSARKDFFFIRLNILMHSMSYIAHSSCLGGTLLIQEILFILHMKASFVIGLRDATKSTILRLLFPSSLQRQLSSRRKIQTWKSFSLILIFHLPLQFFALGRESTGRFVLSARLLSLHEGYKCDQMLIIEASGDKGNSHPQSLVVIQSVTHAPDVTSTADGNASSFPSIRFNKRNSAIWPHRTISQLRAHTLTTQWLKSSIWGNQTRNFFCCAKPFLYLFA